MASVIRLLDSTGINILDSVSTEYEDSFSLDTFQDSITQHESSDPQNTKHFILARVQTWDPKQPEKAFYSYYNAYNLNKILFQTQLYMEKRLIHRLHVLNPLTNTDIIGHVQYFKVRAKGSFGKVNRSDEKISGSPVHSKGLNTVEIQENTSIVTGNRILNIKPKLGLSIKVNKNLN